MMPYFDPPQHIEFGDSGSSLWPSYAKHTLRGAATYLKHLSQGQQWLYKFENNIEKLNHRHRHRCCKATTLFLRGSPSMIAPTLATTTRLPSWSKDDGRNTIGSYHVLHIGGIRHDLQDLPANIYFQLLQLVLRAP